MIVTPMNYYILIEPAKAPPSTITLLKDPKQYHGKVLAIGDKVKEIKVNDHIYFLPSRQTEVTVGKETYYLVQEEDVVGTA